MQNFGQTLRRLRREKGLSLRDVQKQTGISNAYLSQIESGRRHAPTPRFLRKLAELYGVPVQELMYSAGYLDEPSPPPDLIETLFEHVTRNTPFRCGFRLSSDVDQVSVSKEMKLYVIRMYEKATGEELLPKSEESS